MDDISYLLSLFAIQLNSVLKLPKSYEKTLAVNFLLSSFKHSKLTDYSPIEGGIIQSVAVKSVDLLRHTGGEGGPLE